MTNTRSTSASVASSSTLQSGPPATPPSRTRVVDPASSPQQGPKPRPTKGQGLTFVDDDKDLAEINTALRKNPVYLGNPDLLQHVKWVETGRQRRLVPKDDDGEDEPVVLEWIGEVSPWNFWLYACGGWNGELGPNNNWTKATPFEKAKARARVRAPSHPTLAADWEKCIVNVKALMTTVTDSSHIKITAHSLLDDGDIKIRHAIFEPKNETPTDDADAAIDDKGKHRADDEVGSSDGDTIKSERSSQLDPVFSTENMPCRSVKASEALDRIKNEGLFDFSPLPATDMRQKPITPSDYERKLSGALVLVRATLSSDQYQGRGHQFYADIESLIVLRPPKAPIPSPSKSPSKKRRFDVPDYVRHARSRKL